jgi:large subunit ribosomal protein L10
MSKFVKNLIMRDVTERFQEVESVGVINPRGINATKNNQIRRRLHEKGIQVTVVKNSLARRTLTAGRLKGFEQLLEGPCALVYGKVSISQVARALLDEKKTEDKLELRGIFFDGEIYPGQKGVEDVSRLPTREEAIGRIAAALMGPGSKLAAALKGPGSTLAGILKAIEEKAGAAQEPAPSEAALSEAAPSEAAPSEAAPAAEAQG